MLFLDIIIYAVSFLAIWYGAGLIIQAVDGVSKYLNVSTFALSFFVLGLLTSIPEFAVGITAVAAERPNIFVGNLLGGIAVILLFVIPVLAILGKEVKMSRGLHRSTLLFSLSVMALPAFFALDQKLSNIEAILLILAYGVLFYFIQSQQGMIDSFLQKRKLKSKRYTLKDVFFLFLGVVIVFISSNQIVEKTIEFSQLLQVSPFMVSLLILSLGTNLPELSIAVRSIISGKKDVALGDYLGSASANTLLLGIFTFMSQGAVIKIDNFAMTFFFILLGTLLFYIYSRSERNISRFEGVVLLSIYVIFVVYEVMKGLQPV